MKKHGEIEVFTIDKLIPYELNNKIHGEEQVNRIANSIIEFGFTVPILVDEKNVILAGHKRLAAAKKLGLAEVPVIVKADLTEAQKKAYRIIDNKATQESHWDYQNLELELKTLEEMDFDVGQFIINDFHFETVEPEVCEDDFEPTISENTFIEKGDIIELGAHRVLCGDSTLKDNVEHLMNGQQAKLLHADPPYGMGKEKDGILNDNLYGSKLDQFQMEWWKAFRSFLTDTASVYIWGNAEDLWRLWFQGGLKDSERMTFRNEIVWDKGHGQGILSEGFRSYPVVTERCLFFMLGEQGFSSNADNYWDGWDTVLNYLKAEKEKTGWDIATFKRLAGHSETSGCHWFDRSQWAFPTKEVYESWQRAARELDAFKREYDDLKREYDDLKREYDDLKREFYSTRSLFDNTHDKMTDVWSFPRVIGEERFEHATPKPVSLISRAIKSSSESNSLVIEPFLGSGSTLIAAEKTSRICYGMEINPQYCEVIIERYQKYCEAMGKEFECRVNGEPYYGS